MLRSSDTINVTVDGVKNPTDNTDIFLTYSDDGGRTWSTPTASQRRRVRHRRQHEAAEKRPSNPNDSHRPSPVPAGDRGRSHDGNVGPLVARRPRRRRACPGGNLYHDQHRRRTDVCAQRLCQPVTDGRQCDHRPTEVLGPEIDNESAGNNHTDTMFGYGTEMGLAVYGGQVYPIWAGNFNLARSSTAPSRAHICRSISSRWSSPQGRGSSVATWGQLRMPRRPAGRSASTSRLTGRSIHPVWTVIRPPRR